MAKTKEGMDDLCLSENGESYNNTFDQCPFVGIAVHSLLAEPYGFRR